MSLKYKILPFNLPRANNKRGLLCNFQKANFGGLVHYGFYWPLGEVAKTHILWSHRKGEFQSQDHGRLVFHSVTSNQCPIEHLLSLEDKSMW